MKMNKDPVLKDYFLVKDRFADMFNAAIFHGEQVLLASLLRDADADSSTVFDLDSHEILAVNRGRDCLCNAVFIILGLENQSSTDYIMPLRNFFYDAITYNKQYRLYKDESKKNRKVRFKLIPVMTLTFYHGKDKWTGPRSLLDMMDIPDELKNIDLNNWNAYIVDIKDIDPSLFHNEDNRQLVECVQRLFQWDGKKESIEDMNVSKELGIAIASITGKKELIENIKEQEGETVSMYDSIQRALDKSKNEGTISTLVKLLTQKIGILPKEIVMKIEQSTEEQLETLTIQIFDIQCEDDILHILSS